MRDDDDQLATYDLDAWEVPPPSPGLVDAVIARATQPAGVVPLEEPRPERRRRGFAIAGGVVAALVAAVALVLWGTQRAPTNGTGEVIATRAQRVELGASSVQLDPGAELHWRRDKHRLTASQPRGSASWQVGEDDTLVIDAGAMVASVEAAGASLRVEVTMNVSDGRVIGASALTAAVVAMVTVVVYEGHVKVASGGQTVVVEPGSRYEVRNPALEPPPVSGSVIAAQLADKDGKIAELKRQIAELQQTRPAPPTPPTPSTPSVPAKTIEPPCDETACILDDPPRACCERFKKSPKPAAEETATCDAAMLAQKGNAHFDQGQFEAALAAFEASNKCTANPTVQVKAALAACRSKNAARAKVWVGKLPAEKRDAITAVCVREGIDVSCDADALRDKGHDHLQTGMDAAALASFEASMACRPDASLMRLAFMAACRAKNEAKARFYFGKLPPATTTGITQICERNGIVLAEASRKTKGGLLRITAKPAATVFIDKGKAGVTPITARVPAGKHTLTFQVGDRVWTYPVTVEDGTSQTITKDLR